MIWLLASALAAPVIGVERVDLISEDPGTFVNYELVTGASVTTRAMRWLFQIKVVWFLPVEGLTVGTSLTSQSLAYERSVFRAEPWTLFVGGGVQTALLLPRGLWADAGVRLGPVRVALGASVLSSATWARPDWSAWTVLPTIGIGVGRSSPPPIWQELTEARGGPPGWP